MSSTTLFSRIFALGLLFAGVSPSLPQNEPAEPTANERSRVDVQRPSLGVSTDRNQMADDYLQPRVAQWQRRLKLSGWKVTLVQVKLSDLRPGTLGNIHWDDADKTAKIRVLSASEYKLPYEEALRDMECTLVHELVHLSLASLPRSDASREQEEQAVVGLTEALLALDRGE